MNNAEHVTHEVVAKLYPYPIVPTSQTGARCGILVYVGWTLRGGRKVHVYRRREVAP